jgi:hypothetical protein
MLLIEKFFELLLKFLSIALQYLIDFNGCLLNFCELLNELHFCD